MSVQIQAVDRQFLLLPSIGVSVLPVPSPPWWQAANVDPVGAYQAKGVASQADSYINLVTPGTLNLTLGTAPSWSAVDGWSFVAASSQYLKTGIVPSATCTMILRVSAAAQNGTIWCGATDASNFQTLIYGSDATHIAYRMAKSSGTSGLTIVDTATDGVYAVTEAAAYNNGVSQGSFTGVATALAAGRDAYIGARNQNTVAANFSTLKVQAFAIFTTSLSGAQITELTNAMLAL